MLWKMEGEIVGKMWHEKILEWIRGSLTFMTNASLHTRAAQNLLEYDL